MLFLNKGSILLNSLAYAFFFSFLSEKDFQEFLEKKSPTPVMAIHGPVPVFWGFRT